MFGNASFYMKGITQNEDFEASNTPYLLDEFNSK